MSKSTVSVGCHLDPWNLQLTTACRSQMSVAVNAGDWLAEIDQVSRSHAVSTLVHINAQLEPNPVSDIQPVYRIRDLLLESNRAICKQHLKMYVRNLPIPFSSSCKLFLIYLHLPLPVAFCLHIPLRGVSRESFGEIGDLSPGKSRTRTLKRRCHGKVTGFQIIKTCQDVFDKSCDKSTVSPFASF